MELVYPAVSIKFYFFILLLFSCIMSLSMLSPVETQRCCLILRKIILLEAQTRKTGYVHTACSSMFYSLSVVENRQTWTFEKQGKLVLQDIKPKFMLWITEG